MQTRLTNQPVQSRPPNLKTPNPVSRRRDERRVARARHERVAL